MEILGVNSTEALVLLLVGLLIFGPQQLLTAWKQWQQFIASFRANHRSLENEARQHAIELNSWLSSTLDDSAPTTKK